MEEGSPTKKEVCVVKESVDEIDENQLCKDASIGDVIWAKLNGSFWWPAQVVDENSVSGSCKPSSRADGEILARLYGSYKYMYVDWVKSRSEFLVKLKENNGSYHDLIAETLQQELDHLKSGGRLKRRAAKSKSVVSPKTSTKTHEARSRKRKNGEQQNIEPNTPKSLRSSPKKPMEAPKSQAPAQQTKNQNRNGNQKNQEHKPLPEPSSTQKSQERSARKLKVMQCLGLIPPSDSPFQPKHLNFSKPV